MEAVVIHQSPPTKTLLALLLEEKMHLVKHPTRSLKKKKKSLKLVVVVPSL